MQLYGIQFPGLKSITKLQKGFRDARKSQKLLLGRLCAYLMRCGTNQLFPQTPELSDMNQQSLCAEKKIGSCDLNDFMPCTIGNNSTYDVHFMTNVKIKSKEYFSYDISHVLHLGECITWCHMEFKFSYYAITTDKLTKHRTWWLVLRWGSFKQQTKYIYSVIILPCGPCQINLGITIILHFCHFCIIALAKFWWVDSTWPSSHKLTYNVRN